MDFLLTPLSIAFLATTVLSIWLFARSSAYPQKVFGFICLYAIIQFLIGATGFYENTISLPPRFLLNLLPGLLALLWLLFTKRGREFQEKLSPRSLLLVHSVRVPVELVLYGLFLRSLIPEIMTFAGQNFDIMAGLTAPLVWFFYAKLSPRARVVWHLMGILLLANIVVTALLAAPLPFQQIAFDQPNLGVLQAPFNLLPAVVVPLVFAAHFTGLGQLRKRKS
ncbi:MAG: hypothetical protein AAGA62_15100 [Bacteroidota bacterium]